MSSSLGKALERSKRMKELQGRRNYRDMMANEREATVVAEERQQAAEREKRGLKSIWETNDLDNFLSIADARESGYNAERNVRLVIEGTAHVVRNNKVIPEHTTMESKNKWLELSEKLTIPRRPEWAYNTSAIELQMAEREAFTNWRRSLGQMEEEHKVLMTPYEKNLEVWRQLWRVVERADIVTVILDARNPLMFRCKDFESYVRQTKNAKGEPKKVVLLLNKSDLLTEEQRKTWADYFQKNGDSFYFFSAKPLVIPAVEAAPRVRDPNGEDDSSDEGEEEEEFHLTAEQEKAALSKIMKKKKEKSRHKKKSLRAPVEVANPYELAAKREAMKQQSHQPKVKEVKPLTEEEKARTERVQTQAPIEPWTVLDPVQLLDQFALLRAEAGVTDENTSLMVGLVGYPNVGKSSTINAIIGCKKVVVSSTPGKTKHFQTLVIPEERRVALCDCPGLVFPSFASTTAQMVCDGILPVDTATDAHGASDVVCRRLPRPILEYALNISLLAEDDVDESHSLGERLLNAMARRRGYLASHDRPNRARAGKELLKLYVDGYFVYAEPPPTYHPDAADLQLSTYLAKRGIGEGGEDDAEGGEEEEFEDLNSEEEEAWAELEAADRERALSDYGDNFSVQSDVELAAPPMFYARPQGLPTSFTRYEYFNLEANETRMAENLNNTERRRRKKVNPQLEPDMYTFINRDGEVELRLDDDDGVLELVTPTGGPVRPATKAKPQSKKQMRRQMKQMGAGPTNKYGQKMGIQDY